MSQASTLLDSLDVASVNANTEPHIVIGEDRYIVVPRELRRLAVQFDKNVETVTFDCPRYWDEHDLSTMSICINYMRPDGEPGCDEAKNVTVDATDDRLMHFDWTVDKHVTMVNGDLSVLVKACLVDEEGNETRSWHTELCQDMCVSKGMDCNGAIVAKYPDVITDILMRLRKMEEGGGNYVKTVNGMEPDENGDVTVDIPTAVTDALTQAKESGEFDGEAGPQGPQGETGEAGYTPVKGTDYYTEADKQEMVNAVLSALPTWEGGSY